MRLTRKHVEQRIAKVEYFELKGGETACLVTLDNNYSAIGQGATNAEAREDAIEQMWEPCAMFLMERDFLAAQRDKY